MLNPDVPPEVLEEAFRKVTVPQSAAADLSPTTARFIECLSRAGPGLREWTFHWTDGNVSCKYLIGLVWVVHAEMVDIYADV